MAENDGPDRSREDGEMSVSSTTTTDASPAGSSPEILPRSDVKRPTESHALAEESLQMDSKDKGASQMEHDYARMRDLGWNGGEVPRPVVGGLSNEDLWTLIRRFDKQVFHVKTTQEPPLAGLDLNTADGEEFSPQKLRAQLERLYMTALINIWSAYKHVARLRSWREWKRTVAFLIVYSAAWMMDVLFPTIVALLMILILHPPTRPFLFPPAPPSLIDPITGGIQKPPAGVLASDDSATGAPEKHKGEAVEQEAHSFVTSIASVCSGLVTSTAAGKRPRADPYEDTSVPDPTEITADVAYARDRTDGDDPTVANDRTREPVARAVWDLTRPVMHILSGLVDTWERFGNALAPVAPFPPLRPRLRLASCLVPPILVFYFASHYIILKTLGFVVGFAFFGRPVIVLGTTLLDQVHPNWLAHLMPQHNILRGVPTNAQLALTLLRAGERARSPLPPPPVTVSAPPMEPHATAGQDLDHLGVPQEEIQEAIRPEIDDQGREPLDKRAKRSKRVIDLLKVSMRGGIHSALAVDKARAVVGERQARNRLGVVRRGGDPAEAGPIIFPARYRGSKGFAVVTTTAATPAISWSSRPEGTSPVWSVAVEDIAELRKVGGLGWKSKIAVGWAMGAEVVDGIAVKPADGQELRLTAVTMRDELFNRLISIGGQMWEAW